MRKFADLALSIAVVSMVIGIFSRIMVEPIQGIEAHAIFAFAQTCLLLSIAIYVRE